MTEQQKEPMTTSRKKLIMFAILVAHTITVMVGTRLIWPSEVITRYVVESYEWAEVAESATVPTPTRFTTGVIIVGPATPTMAIEPTPTPTHKSCDSTMIYLDPDEPCYWQ